MVQVRSSEHSFVSEFEALRAREEGSAPEWLQSLRQDAFREFESLGFPTTRDEDWKYTNVAPIARQRFELPQADLVCALPKEGFLGLGFSGGRCVTWPMLAEGVENPARVHDLAGMLKFEPKIVEPHLKRTSAEWLNGFGALNNAFLADGAFVHVPAGAAPPSPIFLHYTAARNSAPSMTHPHNLIIIEKGGRAVVIERYAGGEGSYLTNTVTNIVVEDGARLEWYKVQVEGPDAYHVSTTNVTLARDSAFTSFTLDLGARIGRNDLSVRLEGEGAECTMNGLYIASGNGHIDNHTSVEHIGSFTPSRQLYKGVLADRARAVFNGKIIARRGTHQVDAHQANNNLLLSDRSMVDTKPQLEIFADDLKCSHGATVGQLDEEAIFYLASRGIGAAQSRRILTYGFVEAVLALAPDARMRDHMSSLVREKLSRWAESGAFEAGA